MSGFAYNLKYTTAMTPPVLVHDDEGAGKVGKVLGAIVAIAIPFVAPAVWGFLAGSTAIGASISGVLTGAFGASVGGIIGSAGVGALMGAAASYAQGARGGQVWAGALSGGLGAGIGQFTNGLAAANAANTSASAGLNALGKASGPVSLAPTAGTLGTGSIGSAVAQNAGGLTAVGATASNGASAGVMQSITRMFGNNPQLVQRLGAAVVNAAVNGDSIAGMEDIVAQQRAELQALQQQDAAAYAQRIAAAQQVVAAADRMDPNWLARVRMADVAGIENREAAQGMRNIAVRQGGSLDAGQRKAYERAKDLHIGRSKALAYGRGWTEGTQGQAQLYGQAAGLFTGPNFAPWEADTNLQLGLQRAKQQANRDTAAGFTAAFGERTYAQPTSPETNTNQNNNDDPFADGTIRPFGRGG